MAQPQPLKELLAGGRKWFWLEVLAPYSDDDLVWVVARFGHYRDWPWGKVKRGIKFIGRRYYEPIEKFAEARAFPIKMPQEFFDEDIPQ